MDLEKKFRVLAEIHRASHFAWRRAIQRLAPDLDPQEVVLAYWEEVGRDTARYYARKMAGVADRPRALAELFVASSVVMGEAAEVVGPAPEGGVLVRHSECPWFRWHEKEGLLAEDRAGCDRWLETVVAELNRLLGARLRFETRATLPGGGEACVRRFWEEDHGAS